MKLRGLELLLIIFAIGFLLCASQAQAMQFSSDDFLIDAATLNNVGGASGSTNYQLESSGGEAVIGNGSGGSYKLAAGYVAQVVTPAISVSVQPSGLVGFYPLDEDAGTVVHDDSINAFLGSFVDSPSWQTGKLGSALQFNGSNQSVDFADKNQAKLSVGTIELWLKTSQSSGTATLAGKYSSWELALSSGKLLLYDFSTNTSCTSSTSIADDNWHHVAMTLDSGVASGSSLFVDGAKVKSCSWTPANQSGSVTLAVRKNGASYSQRFKGLLDHIKIFDRKLTAEEVAAEFSAQNQGAASGLTLGTVLPGVSSSAAFDIAVLTSGSSFTLAINQDHDLKQGAQTISAISGSVASPISWSEGTTKGLGLTLKNATSTPIDVKWDSGSKYAALPDTAKSIYTKTGTQGNSKDVVTAELRLDTAKSQPSGEYQNTMVVTGTAAP